MKRIDIAAYGAPEEVASCIEVPDVGNPGPGEVVIEGVLQSRQRHAGSGLEQAREDDPLVLEQTGIRILQPDELPVLLPEPALFGQLADAEIAANRIASKFKPGEPYD